MSHIFPKNIFQVWFQGIENLTEPKFLENIKNWKVLNPNWNYKLLSDSDLRSACQLFSKECLEIYDSLSTMHMKIDLGRYVLVYLYGGLYTDIDMYAIRSLDYSTYIQKIIRTYQRGQHVIGLSNLSFLNKLEQTINGKYNNAMIICSPKNPTMKKFIEYVLHKCKNYNSLYLTTGPYSFNQFFQNPANLTLSKFIKIPQSVFEPCDLIGNCYIVPETISIHQFEISWMSPRNKKLALFYYKYIRNLPTLIIVFLIVFFIYKRILR